jgi:hypothetical protein
MNTLITAINKESLIDAANLAWKGMLAIFIVMALIFVAIIVLNKVTTIKKGDISEKMKKLKTKFSKRQLNAVPSESKDAMIDTEG